MIPATSLAILLLPLFQAPAPQRAGVERYRDDVLRILRAGLADGRAYGNLAELVAVAPHRLSGSPGAAAAVEWGRQAMLREGLENVRLEECLVPRWVRGEVEELTLLEPAELAGTRLAILALGGSVATPPEGITAEVIEVQDFDALAALGEAARGKIVLFDRPMQDERFDTFEAYGGAVDQRARGASRAAAAGAVAALVRSMTTRRDDVPHTGALRYDPELPALPAAAVSTNGAERVARLLRAGRPVRAHLRLDCRTLAEVPSANVVGELVGRELPDEVVLVGGHLDAWDVGQGAHDDGAGCCQAIEALALLKRLGLRPRRTLRAVLFMNEENGLRGAQAYFAAHEAELGRHVLACESDRGGFAPRGFTASASGAAWETLCAIGDLLAPAGAGTLLPGQGGADLSPMRGTGVVLMELYPDSQRYFDVHHSERDTLDQVNPRELELGAACMAALLYVVADLPQSLRAVEQR